MRTSRTRRERMRRCLALVLTVCMVLQSGINAALAAVNGGYGWEGGLALEDGRCIHHPVHTEECGYHACSHVHTEECYETRLRVLSDEELASASDMEIASPSDMELASDSDAELATSSDVLTETEQTGADEAETATMSNAEEVITETATASDAEEDLNDEDGSIEDEELLNDVVEDRVLDCKHKHDQNCGYRECTFVCPYGCRYTGIIPVEEPVITLKEGAVLVAGEEYDEEELLELVERVEITNAVSSETEEGELSGVASVKASEPEEEVVWENEADEQGFSFFGLKKAKRRSNASKEETAGFIPQREAGFYTVTYQLQDAENIEIKTAAVNIPVATSLEVENVTITATLNKLSVGTTQNLLEGVLVTPDITPEGEKILLEVENVVRFRKDGTQDMEFVWELTEDENGDMQPLVTPTIAGSKYTVTYKAYLASDPETYVEKVVELPVTGMEQIGEMLIGDQALISKAEMVEDTRTESKQAIRTGTVPWDDIKDKNNYEDPDTKTISKPGIDFGDYDNIVRSFDTITYTVNFSTAMHAEQNDSPGFKEGRLYFEFILPVGKEYAAFETEGMGWLETRKNIESKIEECQVPTADGTWEKGQVLRGSFILEPNQENPVAIGGSYNELNVAVHVLAMTNGMSLKPRFTFWLDGNDVGTTVDGNHIPNGDFVAGSNYLCKEHGIQEYKTIEPSEVTVTAAPWYNIQILNSSSANCQVPGTFDFGTGNDNAPFRAGARKVEGELGGYGITLQIAGKVQQGLRGVEIPDGSDITFDLKLSSTFKRTGTKTSENVTQTYMPMFWSLQGNRGNRLKDDGRQIPNYSRAPYACTSAPYNTGSAYHSCYNGGKWSYEWDENDPTVLHVTVSGYQIDLTKLPYTNTSQPSNNYYYYNPDTIGNSYWNIQKACFSAGEVWVVQPFVDENGVRITDKYPGGIDVNSGAGTFSTTLSAINMKARSISGQELAPALKDNSNQSIRNDDQCTQLVYVDRQGNIEQYIQFLKYGKGWPNYLTDGCGSNGNDWTTIGGGLNIFSHIDYVLPEAMGVGVAYDVLVKFDDAFFVPEKIYSYNQPAGTTRKTLWATKKNGEGWDHVGQNPDGADYDTEMKMAKIDDLVFYTSLDSLKKEGKTCVGVMVEYRGTTNEGYVQPGLTLQGTINPNVSTNYVYMADHNSRAWSKRDVKKFAESKGILNVENWTDADYTKFVRNTEYFPSREDHNVTNYNNYPDAFWIKEYDSPNQYELLTYEKTKYDKNGGIIGDSTAGVRFGDCCLVLGFNSEIEKSVAQKSKDGVEKSQYDMDINQRVVDYVLYPAARRGSGEGSTAGATFTDTFYIEDTIPTSLEYIPGSSYWDAGGNDCHYEESSDPREPGTVHGEQFNENTVPSESSPWKSVEVTKNAKGETVLKWTLGNVTFDANDPHNLGHIHFSCKIGTPDDEITDVKNQDQIDNTAKIWSNLDLREINFVNKNKSSYGFHITKNRAISISKIAEESVVELGDNMSFMMNVGNNGDNTMEDTFVIERLPHHDDGESKFNGDLIVESLRVGSKRSENYNAVMNGFKFYYTTNTEYRGLTEETLKASLRAVDISNHPDWHEMSVEEDPEENKDLPKGVITDLPTKAEQKENPIVAIVAYGDLPAMKTLRMHIKLGIDGGEPGDYIVNHLSRSENESRAKSSIVSRVLEGVTWLDDDKNGLRTNNESQIEGVTVTLMKLKSGGNPENEEDYEPYTFTVAGTNESKTAQIQTGEKMNLLTGAVEEYDGEEQTAGENGGYRFYNLPEGIFGVRFSDGTIAVNDHAEPVDLAEYKASPVNVGINESIDSDGVPTYRDKYNQVTEDVINGYLDSTFIADIVMPPKSQITNRIYYSSYHDSGFYGPRATIRVAKWINNWNQYHTSWEKNDLVKDEFVITVTDNDDFRTGVVLNHSGDSEGKFDLSKASGYIEVYPGKNGTDYTIDEIIPKEYTKAAPFLTDEGFKTLSGNTVNVKPGEDVIVLVHNKFKHDDYFHDDASALNNFAGKKSSEEPDHLNQTGKVDLTAVIPEKNRSKRKQSDEEETFM